MKELLFGMKKMEAIVRIKFQIPMGAEERREWYGSDDPKQCFERDLKDFPKQTVEFGTPEVLAIIDPELAKAAKEAKTGKKARRKTQVRIISPAKPPFNALTGDVMPPTWNTTSEKPSANSDDTIEILPPSAPS